MAKVLLVDDDELVRYSLARLLRKAGHEVIETGKPLLVPEMIQQDTPDILITDIVMPDQDGIGLIRDVKKNNPSLPILAISGGGRMIGKEYLGVAKDLGANAVLEKPVDNEELLAFVNQLVA